MASSKHFQMSDMSDMSDMSMPPKTAIWSVLTDYVYVLTFQVISRLPRNIESIYIIWVHDVRDMRGAMSDNVRHVRHVRQQRAKTGVVMTPCSLATKPGSVGSASVWAVRKKED